MLSGKAVLKLNARGGRHLKDLTKLLTLHRIKDKAAKHYPKCRWITPNVS